MCDQSFHIWTHLLLKTICLFGNELEVVVVVVLFDELLLTLIILVSVVVAVAVVELFWVNLLSRIESNSASCSLMLVDSWSAAAVSSAVAGGSSLPPSVAVCGGVEGLLAASMPRAWGGTVTSRFPCRMIHRPVALWTSTCLSPHWNGTN